MLSFEPSIKIDLILDLFSLFDCKSNNSLELHNALIVFKEQKKWLSLTLLSTYEYIQHSTKRWEWRRGEINMEETDLKKDHSREKICTQRLQKHEQGMERDCTEREEKLSTGQIRQWPTSRFQVRVFIVCATFNTPVVISMN